MVARQYHLCPLTRSFACPLMTTSFRQEPRFFVSFVSRVSWVCHGRPLEGLIQRHFRSRLSELEYLGVGSSHRLLVRLFQLSGQPLLDTLEEVAVTAERGQHVGVAEALLDGKGTGAQGPPARSGRPPASCP